MDSSEENVSEERTEDDIINILVATDTHLGYAEKDRIRGQDTFVTFEEILKIAVQQNVDFLLLGGDLFHETRPSAYCIYKCTELLKKYCLGDKPVSIEFLSDSSRNFSHTGNVNVNYEDPNLNVSLPVFSIHGNHDDPTGEHQISALNLLASAGLINYFGRWEDHSQVEIEPILLKKGDTNLALYGLSHIKDERLGRLFLDKKVSLLSPNDPDNWFHLLVLHQNRAHRSSKNFIPDNVLPDILDLVIWGHEHDCRIVPEPVHNNVYICQPGSSVATSLCVGEAIPKHVGLLKIHKKSFNVTPIPLKTVRPFIYKDLLLKDPVGMQDELEMGYEESLSHAAWATKIVEKEVEKMINDALNMGQLGNLLPLIRLCVQYQDEKQVFNAIRFGQRYIDRVANPEDMVKLNPYNKKKAVRTKKDGAPNDDAIFEDGVFEPVARVEDLVLRHFETEGVRQLVCLPVKALTEAVMKFIDTHEDDAPLLLIEHLAKETCEKLEENVVEIDAVDQFIQNLMGTRDDKKLVENVLNNPNRKIRKKDDDDIESCDSDIDDSSVSMSKVNGGDTSARPARGRGSRGGKVSQKPGTSRAKGRAGKKV